MKHTILLVGFLLISLNVSAMPTQPTCSTSLSTHNLSKTVVYARWSYDFAKMSYDKYKMLQQPEARTPSEDIALLAKYCVTTIATVAYFCGYNNIEMAALVAGEVIHVMELNLQRQRRRPDLLQELLEGPE